MVDFDSKEAKNKLKRGYKPRSVNGYIVLRKGNDSAGIGLKDTEEGWEAIRKLQEEVAKEIANRESRGKPVETPPPEEPKDKLPPGSTPSDLKVAKSVTSPEKPQDATREQHLYDATRDHAIDTRLGHFVRFDVMHYCNIPEDKRENADEVLGAFKDWWGKDLLPLVKDSHVLHRSNIALMVAERKITELVSLYLQKEKALEGLNATNQLLINSSCETCKTKVLKAMTTAALTLPTSQQEVQSFQEKYR